MSLATTVPTPGWTQQHRWRQCVQWLCDRAAQEESHPVSPISAACCSCCPEEQDCPESKSLEARQPDHGPLLDPAWSSVQRNGIGQEPLEGRAWSAMYLLVSHHQQICSQHLVCQELGPRQGGLSVGDRELPHQTRLVWGLPWWEGFLLWSPVVPIPLH